MADRKSSTYIKMTSMDIMTQHQPDDFHFVLDAKGNTGIEELEAKSLSTIEDFKTSLLSDKNGSEKVTQFMNECFGKGLKKDSHSGRVGKVIETLYERKGSVKLSEATSVSQNHWFDLPFKAIDNNRLDILTICFRTGVDIGKYFWKDTENLLMYAVSLASVDEEILKLLLRHIDVNNESMNGTTAIYTCLRNRMMRPEEKIWLLKTLIDSGFRIVPSERILSSPIHNYVYSLTSLDAHVDENWKEIIDILLEASQDIGERDYLGQNPLMVAVSSVPQSEQFAEEVEKRHDESGKLIARRLEIIKYLIQKGADPNSTDYRGNTSIHHAAISGNISCLKLLLNCGAKAEIQNRLGMTAIYSICAEYEWSGGVDEIHNWLFPVLRELLAAGCNINSQAMDRTNVLHHAAAKLPVIIVRFLCEQGADASARDYLGRTPLHMASRNNNPGIVRCLMEFRPNIEAINVNSDTPLHFACLHNNFECVHELLELGANVEAVGDLGIRPLHLAAENGSKELLNLIANRADVEAADIWGATPLHYGASDGNYETVEALIKLGADRNRRDSQNMTPLGFALFRGDSLKTAQILANDDSVVRFGNLPPLYFPHRPVIKQDEMDEYFDGLIQACKNADKEGLPLARDLLDCRGLGHVHLDKGEAKTITKIVTRLIERMVKRIGELDNMFEAKLIRAGSTFEDVKTGFPDEYDFLCDMVKFSRHIDRTESGDAEGFTRVMMREDSPPEVLKYCLDSPKRCINASFFLQRFSQLARQAMYDVLSDHNPHIYTGHMLVRDNIHLFDPLFYQKVKLHGQTMTFRGELHKFLDVSVDLNPVLFSPVLPTEFIQSCTLLGDMSSKGIYLLPKHCAQILSFPMAPVPHNADLWRYSTHHIEAEVLHRLPTVGRECYVLCKLLRMEPLTCGVEIPRPEYQMFSEKNLQKLCPEGSAMLDDDDDYEDSQDDVSANDEGDNAGEDEYEDGDAVKNRGDSEKNSKGDGAVNVLAEGVGDSGDSEADTSIQNEVENDFDYDLKAEDSEEDDFEEEDEMSAENAIPSYYLKSIFIKEAEKLLKEGGTFDEDCLIKIPWRVYKHLQEASEIEELTTLFLPSQNMFQRAVKSDEYREAEKLRKLYCRNILRVMESLGLKE